MLRLLRQLGVRVTTRSITQQRIQHRGYRFINGSTDELKAKQKSDNDRLRDRIVWDIINKVDDRVHDLRKDLGDFKGDVYKSIGELATAKRNENRAEARAGIGSVKDEELESNCKLEGVQSDLKRTKWQVRLLFGAVILCLVKDYVEARFSRLDMVPVVIPDQNSGPRK